MKNYITQQLTIIPLMKLHPLLIELQEVQRTVRNLLAEPA